MGRYYRFIFTKEYPRQVWIRGVCYSLQLRQEDTKTLRLVVTKLASPPITETLAVSFWGTWNLHNTLYHTGFAPAPKSGAFHVPSPLRPHSG